MKLITIKYLCTTIVITYLLSGCGTGQQDQQKEETLQTDISAQSADPIEDKLKEMGITLYKVTPPSANFVKAVRSGNLVFLAGHGPETPTGEMVAGKLGKDLTVEEGQQAAQYVGVTLLTSLKAEIGNLDKVKKIVKVHGMVNATPDFTDHSKVMNGFSDFIVKLYGDERGKHARAAVGMSSLPNNIPVEIEMIVEVED